MLAKALITAEDQTFSLHEVVLPDAGPGQVMVKVAYSAISIGTEFALIRGKLNWGDFPLCTGYQATGVIQAGAPTADILRHWYGDEVDTSHFEQPGHAFDSVYEVSRIREELGFVAKDTCAALQQAKRD